jgi:hypothetical protein
MDRPVKPSPGEVLRDFSRALATAGTSMVDDSVTAVHANRAQSLVCLLARIDRDGQALDGRRGRYILAFRQPPHVKQLWVLSMLGGDAWSRPLCRYALEQRPETLRFGPDGSLTICIQCTSPGEDPGPNWLAAPSAPFGLTLRLFSPEDSFFDGRYTVPPVARVKP